MMTAQQIRTEWFPKHKVIMHRVIDNPYGMEMLAWKKPNVTAYNVYYVRFGSTLFITGDIGEAVYCWSDTGIDLEWIAACDPGYFWSKCEASELGRNRNFTIWNADRARRAIEEYFDGYEEEAELRRHMFIEHHGADALESEDGWHAWLRDYGSEVLGGEYYEYGGIGAEMHPHCLGHLVGLKMAFESLNADSESTPKEKS
jgi:hypothetical protein